MRNQQQIDRRRFLQASAVVGVGVHTSLQAAESSEDIRVGVIGLKGRGRSHISGFGKHVVAMCDCDEQILEERSREQQVEKFVDYRKLLERQDIDVVSIATPNHTHALIAIAAAAAGKDVYVEKPVSHNVWEGRQIVNAARKYGRMIQTGTQSRSSPSLQQAVAWVRAGNLGKIKYAVGTCYKPRKSIGKLEQPLQLPSHIHYDLWCGPAEMKTLYRPQLHYDWHWDYNTGNGDMGNQGIHQMDIARWFLGEETVSPAVLSVGGRLGYDDAGNTANTQVVLHDYQRAPLIFETRGLPRSQAAQQNWGQSMDNYRGSRVGVLVQCEQGYVVIPSYTSATAFDNKGDKIEAWNGGGNHYQNFLAAVRSRQQGELSADILEGHLSSALCHTGNVSHLSGTQSTAGEIASHVRHNELLANAVDRMFGHLRANGVDIDGSALTLGSRLEMDVTAETITNNDRAAGMLFREDRKPFEVPEIKV